MSESKFIKREGGFTLVEMAIVLVIIGLILGGVLKGQQLIYNAKIKRAISQIKEMQAAFYTYYDKYGAFPGDDPAASSKWTGAPNGDGDGLVEGGYCSAAGEESCNVWRHLRFANIITGDASLTDPASLLPKHVFGGYLDMFTGTYSVGGDNRSGLWITLRNLEAEAAEAIDRALDDGMCNSGSIGRHGGTACDGDGSYPSSGYLEIWMNF